MNILITLCARGGSKGIPGKNIKIISGRPLISLSIDAANSFARKYNAHIVLSTDDELISRVAIAHGIENVHQRQAYLASDSAGKLDVISDVLLSQEKAIGVSFDYVLDLDITSPLRNLEDLSSAFERLKNDELALNIFSVNIANRNPYFNMVEQQQNGYFGLVKTGSFLTRQSAPKVYELNASFYFYRRRFFDSKDPKVINEYSLIYEMPHICFDIDHPVDFDFMEYLLTNDKIDFLS
jgi:CMP-N,N'-diacetyllegionaminic acid synthase